MDLQVSVKGAVSVYYLNRFPFTLYADEWKAVFGAAKVILNFVAAHHVQLSCRCGEEVRQAMRGQLERGEFGNQTRVGSLWCKKATTGAVSLYGLRRFPITLYCDQWIRVLDAMNEIQSFIDSNRNQLSSKGCSVPRVTRASNCRPLQTFVDANNIIRPMTARSYER